MKILPKYCVYMAALSSCYCHADGAIEGAITELAIDRVYGEAKVFIQASGNKDSNPSCHTNSNWSFVLPLSTDLDRNIFSMLLTARATQGTLRLQGRGLCDVHTGMETLSYIKY